MTNGVWLVPTRERFDNLRRLFAAIRDTGTQTQGRLLVQRDEWERGGYEQLPMPGGWGVFVTESEGMAAKCQEYWEAALVVENSDYPPKRLDWIGVLSDDNIPETPKWDALLADSLNGWNLVSSNDGWQAPKRIHGATIFSADLLRAVGYIAPPGLKHLYFDDVWERLGEITSCLQWRLDVMVRHAHADLQSKGPPDATRVAVNSFWADDERVFRDWMQNERPAAAQRITELMKAKGVAMMDTGPESLRGISLLIASPCGSGSYCREYVKPLVNTIIALQKMGAVVDWYDHADSSDLPLARAMLFSAFLRSKHTHMLQIDDDMGWHAMDVVRMLKLDRDFIAAAGPRKAFPAAFAVSNTDDYGKPMPPRMEVGSGVFDMSHVGGAFVMINRPCAEHMASAYKDLEFVTSDGRTHLDLYLPMVRNKQHRGEDFAFCERWRAIGGKVEVLSSVWLSHTGRYTWSGRLDEFLVEQGNKIEAENAARFAAE